MMEIQKDAGEIMALIYKKYVEGEWKNIEVKDIAKETGWDIHRVWRAVKYLADDEFIEVIESYDVDYHLITHVYPEGIETVEKRGKFKKKFGFSVNLGLLQFSWEVEKN